MRISSGFDSGNINCLSCEDPGDIRLEIRKDNQSDFYQWFHFRLSGAANAHCTMKIVNAAGAAYPEGYEEYRAVASYDRETWFRVDTQYEDGVLSIHHTPEFNAVYYAYFAPYSMERHHDLIAEAVTSHRVEMLPLGYTLDGFDMDVLKIGEAGQDKRAVWIIARQHPGETMAEWWMEGLLGKLLDEDDAISRNLLDKCVFYVVPNMNPDGSYRGHLRTNAAGANLNREWLDATMERSPEVFLVRQKMAETGVDFCLDVHGDEALPYNFISGSEGVPSWNADRQLILEAYLAAMVEACPDFQTKFGYDIDAAGKANLTKATNYVAETHNCLAMTLEMPFKDTVETPDPVEGWSPNRSRHLAFSCVHALHVILDRLG